MIDGWVGAGDRLRRCSDCNLDCESKRSEIVVNGTRIIVYLPSRMTADSGVERDSALLDSPTEETIKERNRRVFSGHCSNFLNKSVFGTWGLKIILFCLDEERMFWSICRNEQRKGAGYILNSNAFLRFQQNSRKLYFLGCDCY